MGENYRNGRMVRTQTANFAAGFENGDQHHNVRNESSLEMLEKPRLWILSSFFKRNAARLTPRF